MRLPLALVVVLVASHAHAFCGFFVAGSNQSLSNDASKVALMRKGTKTALTMSNNYKGPPESFAMVVPVPVILKKEDVKTLEPNVFDHIDQLSAPRLVEYWEQDPCAPNYDRDRVRKKGGGGNNYPTDKDEKLEGGVKVEARFAVGEYDIVILSAQEAGGLESWLHGHGYTIPKGAAEALAPYVQSRMKFFVAKVNIQKVHRDPQGVVVLSPLRVIYDAPELRLPVRLGLLNSNGKQDLLVFVLHPTSRFEVANYPNVFIATNLEVVDAVRDRFASFYAQLFDAVLGRSNNRAIVTEYAWQTSSCDPCPVPPLQASDLAVLGDDVLSGNTAKKVAPGQQDESGYYGDASSWVLTRLHTRYSKDTLSEDLVFKEASPVVGGRALYDTQASEPPGEVKADSTNNFQARYIIRHPWKGKVACNAPQRGVWGGPPNGPPPGPDGASAKPATDLASASRSGMSLSKVVRSAVPKLGLPGR